MKKLFTVLALLGSLWAGAQIPFDPNNIQINSGLKISAMTPYFGKADSVWIPGLLGNTNRKFYGVDLAKGRLDSIVNAFKNFALHPDTSGGLLSNYQIALNTRATVAQLAAKMGYTDTATMLAAYRTALLARMRYTDTANMLTAYRNAINALNSAGKVAYTDTAAMLGAYQTAMNAIRTSTMKYTDSTAMLSNYQQTLNILRDSVAALRASLGSGSGATLGANTFTGKQIITSAYASRQLDLGTSGQGGLMGFINGFNGNADVTLGYGGATNGFFQITQTTSGGLGFSSSGSTGFVQFAASGTSGYIALYTGGNINYRMLSNGNSVFQKGGTFVITPSALVAFNSITQGILLPRLTSAQVTAITPDSMGLFLFNRTTLRPNWWDGSTWRASASTQNLADTADQLRTEIAAASATGAPTYVQLTSSDVNNNATANTMEDIGGLAIPLVAGNTYRFRFVIFFDVASNTTTGTRFALNGPAFTRLRYTTQWDNTSTSFVYYASRANYVNTDIAATTAANAVGNKAIIEGIITPSANGNLTPQFASSASGVAVTCTVGSNVEYKQLN